MMKVKYILIAVLSIFIVSCKQGATKEKTAKEESAALPKQEGTIKVFNFDQLEPLLHKKDNKTYVINFWATWCKPCVEELPAFEKLYEEIDSEKVEVLLVSLDFPNQIESELIPFIKNRKLAPEVVVLDDPNQNKWINGVDKSWTGAIPATLIYNKSKRAFFEQSFDYATLTNELQKFIN